MNLQCRTVMDWIPMVSFTLAMYDRSKHCVFCVCVVQYKKFFWGVVHTLVMKIWVGMTCLICRCEFAMPNGDGLDSNGVIHTCHV